MLETSDKDSKNEDSKELKRNGLYCFKKLWSSLAEDVMECKSLRGIVKLDQFQGKKSSVDCSYVKYLISVGVCYFWWQDPIKIYFFSG